ncbi:MAG: CAP domain-containing protein [Rhodospirillales bacterium]|nr:CAP domain-containing protein [Acetobacter sp.]
MSFPRSFLLALWLASTLMAAAAPANDPLAAASPAAPQPTQAATGTTPDRFRDYSPDQFRQLDSARQEIDPANFDEELLSAAIFQETNQRRADLKLLAFGFDATVRAAARKHSDQMAKGNYLSHDSTPDQPKNTTPYDRLVQAGLQPHMVAENIAFNFLLDYDPSKPFYARQEDDHTVYSYQPDGEPLRRHTYVSFAQAIVTQWMNSPPHRENLVNPDLRFLGVGCALRQEANSLDTIYADQDFFTPMPPPTSLQAH